MNMCWYLSAYTYRHLMHAEAHGGQKKALDALELVLQMIVCQILGFWNWIQVFCQSSQ